MEAYAEQEPQAHHFIPSPSKSMKEVPLAERPRERMIALGAQSLRLDELLAIILRTGTQGKSVLRVAQELMETYSLHDLASKGPMELVEHEGLGLAKACELVAVFELARRLATDSVAERLILRSTEEMAAFFVSRLGHLTKEEFHVAYLSTRNHLLDYRVISQGGLSGNLVEPREIFHWALVCKAALIVVAHNHPSGDPEPSGEDLKLTREISMLGELHGVRVLDHFIITSGQWYSMKSKDLL